MTGVRETRDYVAMLGRPAGGAPGGTVEQRAPQGGTRRRGYSNPMYVVMREESTEEVAWAQSRNANVFSACGRYLYKAINTRS